MTTLIDVLNDTEGRELIDTLEDILSSLDGKEGDTMLEDARDNLIAEIQRRFGFTYVL